MTILNFGVKKVGPYFDILNISKILGFPLWLPGGYNYINMFLMKKKLIIRMLMRDVNMLKKFCQRKKME